MTILSINDHTDKYGVCCGNPRGMCCDTRVMTQPEIFLKTTESYKDLKLRVE